VPMAWVQTTGNWVETTYEGGTFCGAREAGCAVTGFGRVC
jgi:hypothetical protein